MKRAFCIAAAMTIAASASWAGPNADGYLVVHTTDTVYTSDVEDYTGMAGLTCSKNFGDCPGDQEDCLTEYMSLNPTSALAVGEMPVMHVLAAFPNDTANQCPRLSGVTFGLEYDDENIFIAGFGKASDFELPTDNWPAPFEGTALTWNSAQKSQIIEVYWFAAYAYYNAGTFILRSHPTQGRNFADDSIPAEVDEIEDFGVFGLGGAPGSNPMPVNPTLESSWGEIKTTFSDNE